jgi:hypothetical protein
MNVVNNSRIRSGDACARWSCRNSAGSILGPAVIVELLFESVVEDHSKDHPVAALTSGRHAHQLSSYTTIPDSTHESDCV